jgi:hypothetical protein
MGVFVISECVQSRDPFRVGQPEVLSADAAEAEQATRIRRVQRIAKHVAVSGARDGDEWILGEELRGGRVVVAGTQVLIACYSRTVLYALQLVRPGLLPRVLLDLAFEDLQRVWLSLDQGVAEGSFAHELGVAPSSDPAVRGNAA